MSELKGGIIQMSRGVGGGGRTFVGRLEKGHFQFPSRAGYGSFLARPNLIMNTIFEIVINDNQIMEVSLIHECMISTGKFNSNIPLTFRNKYIYIVSAYRQFGFHSCGNNLQYSRLILFHIADKIAPF